MKILAINSGSSSIKYRVFDGSKDFHLLKRGVTERIGALADYRTAMHALFPKNDLEAIEAVGHRVVHGGERFKGPTLIDKQVLTDIAKLSKFAPLHCAPNVIGIEVLQDLLPDVPHVAVFDTAAHAEMGMKSFLYGIPLEYYEKHKIRKYGFHGINHAYVAGEAARLLKNPLKALKIVTCHLGNGCSISAFENGKSIDNSMGLTPLEGLVMGTRCGDMDPSVVLFLIDELGLTPEQVTDMLNKKSGLLGLCGRSDMRDILAMADSGDRPALTAIEIFVYRVQKYIGAYIAALNGVDAIVFTGGIGENSAAIRARIVRNFSYLAAAADAGENEKNSSIFSADNSSVFLMNIPANEEKVIAQQAHATLMRL